MGIMIWAHVTLQLKVFPSFSSFTRPSLLFSMSTTENLLYANFMEENYSRIEIVERQANKTKKKQIVNFQFPRLRTKPNPMAHTKQFQMKYWLFKHGNYGILPYVLLSLNVRNYEKFLLLCASLKSSLPCNVYKWLLNKYCTSSRERE